MTHGHYHLFDRRSLAMLHRAALTVLADTGIEMHHEGALQVLTGAGCRVDADRRIARFPAALVKKALRTAPREVILRRADGTPVRLGGDEVHFVPGTSAIELIESGTTHRRSPTCRDTVEFLRLADALDHIGLGAAFGIASDCPAEFWDRYRVYLELKTCAKPSVAGAFTFGAVPEMVRLMDAAGGGDTAAARHRVVVFGCSSPPLKWADFVTQALMDCAQLGVPFGIITMPGIGGTGPATIAGSIVQGHAEVLAGLVLAQRVKPGAEVIHGCSPMLFDARYGAMRGGAIEAMMLVAGLVELGKYLRLPTHAFLGFSDAKVFDQQAAAESAAGLMLAAWEGANCIFGPGMLYSERSTDYAKLVVDNELCGQMLRLARGVTVNAETLAVEQFAAARADEAAFMALDHTLRHYRAETSLPGKVIDVTPFSEWQQAGCPTALDRARAAVERLRAERRPGPLGAAAAARLDAVLRELMAAHGIAALPEGPA